MGVLSVRHRSLQRVVVAALAVALLIIGGALGVIAWATTSIDAVEQTKEKALVQRRLDRSLDKLVEDVNSAAIWNDTVVALSGSPDLDWLQTNLGDYYADYMNHAATLVWGPSGHLVMATRNSEPVAPAGERAFASAVGPLVAQVRAASRAPAKRAASGFDASVSRRGLVRVGAETWLVAVATVVPEDRQTPRPAQDPIVASGQPVSVLIASLDDDLAIRAARFTTATADGEASIALRDAAGGSLGAVAWTPERPGRQLLRGAAPVMLGVLLFLATGAALLFVWIGRVTREQAAAEAALIEARDRAEAANVAKSRFLANMSHELRTPLNGVVGMAEIMAVGELSPIQRSHLDVLRSAAGNLTQMIEHLLQITRLERHEVVIERAPFDPAAAVTRAVEQHAEAARIRGLDLRCDVQPLGRRLGDERHLDQVLGYLIDNALTYTERGGVAVTARQDGETVRIAVADTGMGIRADLKPHLFDVFVQGDDSLTKRFDGVGLGLSICRNLVEAMGGRISVESEEGAGSTFTVDLPLPVVEERTERAAA